MQHKAEEAATSCRKLAPRLARHQKTCRLSEELEAAGALSHVVLAGCGCHFPVRLQAPILGSVLGCLSICIKVSSRGALQHDTATQIMDNFSYWCDNWFYDTGALLF